VTDIYGSAGTAVSIIL